MGEALTIGLINSSPDLTGGSNRGSSLYWSLKPYGWWTSCANGLPDTRHSGIDGWKATEDRFTRPLVETGLRGVPFFGQNAGSPKRGELNFDSGFFEVQDFLLQRQAGPSTGGPKSRRDMSP